MSQPKPGFGNFIAPHETFKLPILRTKTQETCLSLTHLLYIIPEEGKRDLNNIHYGLCFEPLTPLEGLLSTASSIKLLSRDILLRSLFRYIYLGILRYRWSWWFWDQPYDLDLFKKLFIHSWIEKMTVVLVQKMWGYYQHFIWFAYSFKI